VRHRSRRPPPAPFLPGRHPCCPPPASCQRPLQDTRLPAAAPPEQHGQRRARAPCVGDAIAMAPKAADPDHGRYASLLVRAAAGGWHQQPPTVGLTLLGSAARCGARSRHARWWYVPTARTPRTSRPPAARSSLKNIRAHARSSLAGRGGRGRRRWGRRAALTAAHAREGGAERLRVRGVADAGPGAHLRVGAGALSRQGQRACSLSGKNLFRSRTPRRTLTSEASAKAHRSAARAARWCRRRSLARRSRCTWTRPRRVTWPIRRARQASPPPSLPCATAQVADAVGRLLPRGLCQWLTAGRAAMPTCAPAGVRRGVARIARTHSAWQLGWSGLAGDAVLPGAELDALTAPWSQRNVSVASVAVLAVAPAALAALAIADELLLPPPERPVQVGAPGPWRARGSVIVSRLIAPERVQTMRGLRGPGSGALNWWWRRRRTRCCARSSCRTC